MIWSTTTGVEGGRHVVLVHGSLDRSAGLLKLSRRLDERFRVTRYDRRGYGRSLAVGGPFGIEHQVDDLLGVISDADGGAPVIVFGHSYGGNVALALAQRRPELVAGVAVYESPLAWTEGWPNTTAGAAARNPDLDPADAAEQFMRRLIGDARWERLPPATRAARRAEGPALIGELTALAEREPWSPDRIATPVLPMRGERGLEHHLRGTDLLGEWFGVESVVIPGARHFGPNTHPDEVGAAINEWIDRRLATR
jgi:pimeloyl-ACP methyl ester carboxylesterase